MESYGKNYFPWKVKVDEDTWENNCYPKLSVIIPSFNQGEYLEETLLSVINQRYPNLELIVIDGESSDNSVDILKRYSDKIFYWISEADNGQSHAINKGLGKATGEWVAWMNSDDCYLEGGLHYIFNTLEVGSYDFLHGSCASGLNFASYGNPLIQQTNRKKTIAGLLRFFYGTRYIIPSQSVFVRRTILEKAGILDEKLSYVMDMEWFVRIFSTTDRILFYKNAICFFRHNPSSKTSISSKKMKQEAKEVAYRYLYKLGWWDKMILKKLLDDDSGFSKVLFSGHKVRFVQIVEVLLRYPISAIGNRHFWSLLKKSLF